MFCWRETAHGHRRLSSRPSTPGVCLGLVKEAEPVGSIGWQDVGLDSDEEGGHFGLTRGPKRPHGHIVASAPGAAGQPATARSAELHPIDSIDKFDGYVRLQPKLIRVQTFFAATNDCEEFQANKPPLLTLCCRPDASSPLSLRRSCHDLRLDC